MRNRFESEVWILWWKLPCEAFTFTNIHHAMASNDLILKSLRPIWRPFARVKWVQQVGAGTTATEGHNAEVSGGGDFPPSA